MKRLIMMIMLTQIFQSLNAWNMYLYSKSVESPSTSTSLRSTSIRSEVVRNLALKMISCVKKVGNYYLRSWVIVDRPISKGGDDKGQKSFQNKNPSPTCFATLAIQF